MAKILFLLLCTFGINLELTASTIIECEYWNKNWNGLKNSYTCDVGNDPSIKTREFATVTAVSGDHESGKSNSDVEGFRVREKTCHYFPRGLEKFFENIKVISVDHSKLKEIHQEDLKPFPKLVELYLEVNLLEILEEGLFDFNLNLEYIYAYHNSIVHIDANVFDHLSKLNNLWLQSNLCIDRAAIDSMPNVKNVIQTVKSRCTSSNFSLMKAQLELLEKDSKTEDLKAKIDAFEKNFSPSKFFNFRPVNYKLENLKAKATTITTTTCSGLESKVNSIATSLKDLMAQASNGTCSNFEEKLTKITKILNIAD